MYKITNYSCINGVWCDSDAMSYEEAISEFTTIEKQARRGFRPFPDLVDENNNIIM